MKTAIELKQDELFEKKKLKQEIALCGIITVLLLVALFFHPLSILALAISMLSVLFMSEESVLCFLFYVMSFLNIFRLSPSGVSFFILLEFFAVGILILKRKSVDLQHFFGIILLLVYALMVSLFNGTFNRNMFVKFAASLCIIAIFSVCNWERTIKRIVGFFTGGLLVSSVVALLKGILPIQRYISAEKFTITGVESTGGAYRFAGLTPDPNYYVIDITVAIIALIYFIIFNMTEKKPLCLMAIAGLFVFGLLTYSKSFYLMVAFLCLYFFIVTVLKGKYKYSIALIIIGVIGLLVVLSGEIEVVNLGIKRITSSTNVSDLTTNRSNIWMRYFEYYRENFLSFAFGDGIGYTTMTGAAHNTYIEAISTFGIVGSIFLVITLSSIISNRKINRPIENYFITVTIIIMYFFLSSLTWYDTPFQILLAFFFMNLEPMKKAKISATDTLTGSDRFAGKSAKTV